MNENLKTKTNPTMIQQTLHKSMFTKARSNSLGTLPQDINFPEIPFSANDPNKNTWQQDRIPQAKRKRVETKSPQTENIKKSNTSTYAIPTHNQFDILDDEEATTDNKETEKPPKPEPIFVTGVLDINALRNKLKEITTTDDYTMTTLNHYTYMLKSERPYRVVLRGLHSSEDTTEIKEILKENGHEVRQIVNVRHRTSKEPLPLFYVDLEPKSNNRDIFNLKYLNHMKVTFEPPYKKKKSSSAKGAKGLVIPKSVSQTIQMRQVRRPPNQHL
ncbi:Nucleic-acid-binding protein from transposon X-element [Eumeta japonica]|uniref:Nucleic-acid-binding protein from transposon X-element n=1 Tax=Eumeta variegata TaxID=151549 RepID=A0A4C2AAN0_EUMVA|nr:Nucleic-acid-binding protein from transposon X-element [Eumeta japonica]